MPHKTLTISEEAYDALARVKGKDESFTKLILRLTRKKTAGNLLDYVKSFAPDHELADRLEEVLEERQEVRKESKMLRESEKGSLPKLKPFVREEHDRFG